jgi:hypothetical protein
MQAHINFNKKVERYREVLQNISDYRQVWKDTLKDQITAKIRSMIDESGLNAEIEVRTEMENLDAIVLSLGDVKSGMYTQVNQEVQRHMIKHLGSLVYQQLFNGKILVLIQYPYIENYGQPRPPKTIAIYRPEELQEPYIIRHMEEFIKEITTWEDFDDDEPTNKIGFELNFNKNMVNESEQEQK